MSNFRRFFTALTIGVFVGFWGLVQVSQAQSSNPNEQRFVQIQAATKYQRTFLANLGLSIEETRSDSVWGFASPRVLQRIKRHGIKVMNEFQPKVARGGHDNLFGGFPAKDEAYHDYNEMIAELQKIAQANPQLVRLVSLGKSLEKRELFALHFNTDQNALATGHSEKPGVIFMGQHHAREHLSREIPLMLANYLVTFQKNQKLGDLLNSRDIWIVPSVNPDGAAFDIATGTYQMWRKNRRDNGGGVFGVDLNRNYGFGWGTGGSSKDPSSEVYMGTAPFSEPETQVIRDFVSSQKNTRTLLTFHTFSELILYPWGGKDEPVSNAKDRAVFETLGKKFAGWNGYTPEQSSDLYIASGDTVDWSYGTHGIFAFTFELSPKSMWAGGFYPGPIMDRVFKANLMPCLHLIEVAADPYASIGKRQNYLKSLSLPEVPEGRTLAEEIAQETVGAEI